MATEDTALDRAVTLGGTVYTIRPPTVREAAECFAILESVATDPIDEVLLLPVLRRWWPRSVLAGWRQEDVGTRLAALHHLLRAGVTFPKPGSGGKAALKVHADPWGSALAAYCEAYPSDPWHVWNVTPLPFFMAMLGRVRAVMATRTLRHIQAAGVPHAGRSAGRIIADLQDEAGHGRAAAVPAVNAPVDVPDGSARGAALDMLATSVAGA